MSYYLYQAPPEVVNRSSSGGAYRRICQEINRLYPNAIYYGAVWEKAGKVKHKRAATYAEIEQFSGSKYSRSDIRDCFSLIKQDLKTGKTVVFSGVPCQIAAIKSYLSNNNIDTENIILIDIICHGTPQQIVIDSWIQLIEKKTKQKVKNISFRDKNIGWKGYPTKIVFESGKSILHTYDTQLFMRMFLSDFITADSCYKCPFSTMDRESDITIGDFWGVEIELPEFNAGKGVSIMLTNTDKGNKLAAEIQSRLIDNEKMFSIDEGFVKYQHNLNQPTYKPINYERFWNDFESKGFDYVIKAYGFSTTIGRVKFNIKKILSRMGIFKKDYI